MRAPAIAPRRFSPERLLAAREAAGLTREQVATAVNRSYLSVRGWERGVSEPALDLTAALAVLYGVEITAFFDDL